jgi:Peptidase M10 serralysin C terminal
VLYTRVGRRLDFPCRTQIDNLCDGDHKETQAFRANSDGFEIAGTEDRDMTIKSHTVNFGATSINANTATENKGKVALEPTAEYRFVLPTKHHGEGHLTTASLLPHYDTTVPYNPVVTTNLTHVMQDTPGNFRALIIGEDQGNEFYGYGGGDTMVGGTSLDIYHYTSWLDSSGLNTDTIWNFRVDQDKIDISPLTQGAKVYGIVVPIDTRRPELIILGGGIHYRLTLYDGQPGHVLEINLHVVHTTFIADSTPDEIAKYISDSANRWLVY